METVFWYYAIPLAVALPSLLLYAWCAGRKDKAVDGAYTALFSPSVRSARNAFDRRVALAVREAKLGFRECPSCGFTNVLRAESCVLCGVAIQSNNAKGAVGRRLWPGRGQTKTNARVGLPAAALTERQRRIMRRKEWVRVCDENGHAVWHCKEPRTHMSEHHSQFYVLSTSLEEPQTAPQLSSPSADTYLSKDAEAVEVVIADAQSSVPAYSTVAGVAEQLDGAFRATQTTVVNVTSANPTQIAYSSVGDAPDEQKPTRILDSIRAADLDFPTKLAQFITAMASIFSQTSEDGDMTVTRFAISRPTLLPDSINAIATMSPNQARAAVRVEFLGEQGIDAGGVYREWFLLVNEAIVTEEAGIFTCVNQEEQTFYLNPRSREVLGEHHLAHFLAAGRLLGRALLEGNVTGFHLALPLVKIILGLPVGLDDLAYFDPETFRNLKWLLTNQGVENLGLDFTVTEKLPDGKTREVELTPGGNQVDVTDANKRDFIDLKLRYLLFDSVESQLFAFLRGLYEVVPAELLVMFDAEELDYVLSGSDEIDVDDWERNTITSRNLAYYPADELFWKVVRELSPDERRRLLQFATGSTRVPPGGFGALTSNDGRLSLFTLRGVKAKETRGYLHSHACFNRLDLPMHKNVKEMREAVRAAIFSDSIGFTTD